MKYDSKDVHENERQRTLENLFPKQITVLSYILTADTHSTGAASTVSAPPNSISQSEVGETSGFDSLRRLVFGEIERSRGSVLP